MNIEQIVNVEVEIHRLLEKSRLAKARLKEDKMVSITGSKETGALKRASMDLSRALIELRRPWM